MASAPDPAHKPLLKRRPVRLVVGLLIAVLGALMAYAAHKLPFVEIQASKGNFAVTGAAQTKNLHLVLVATGVLGGLLALYYAISSTVLRFSFVVVGGVGAAFTALLLAGAWQTISRGMIADPEIYRQVNQVPIVMAVGSGLWASLAAAGGIFGLGVLVFFAGAPEPEPQRPRRRRL